MPCQLTDTRRQGWRYIDDGNFALGGAYVALAPPDNSEFTIVATSLSNQTAGGAFATQDQTVRLSLVGGWCPSGCQLQQWISNTSSVGVSPYVFQGGVNKGVSFVRLLPDLVVPPLDDSSSSPRTVEVTLPKHAMLTVSTIATAKKGRHPAPPPRAPFPFPFSESFEGYANDTRPRFFLDEAGSFSTEVGAGRSGGTALKQRVIQGKCSRSLCVFFRRSSKKAAAQIQTLGTAG